MLYFSSAEAKDKKYEYGITPYFGFHYFNVHRGYLDESEFGIKLEKFLNKTCSIEGSLGYVRPETESTNEQQNGITYSLNMIHGVWLLQDMINPYVILGIGGDTLDNHAPIGPDAGLGLRLFLIDKVALRFEIRDTYLFTKKNDAIALAGLDYRFGKKKSAPKKEDSDKDGVMDSLDNCPDTPYGINVNSGGCPVDSDNDGIIDEKDKCAGTTRGDNVDSNGCTIVAAPKDSDDDAITDDKDKCPDTPKGEKIDADGCTIVTPPKDSDNDGITDDKDKCPDTPKGEKIDAEGCAIVTPPKDSDNDGITDDKDKCPDTLMGEQIDTNGCPVDNDRDGIINSLDRCPNTLKGEPVNSSGCPVDNDGDGVVDTSDKCPETPRGEQVNTEGCPVDSDRDGVADSSDKCSGTPDGVKTDADGCPLDSDMDGIADNQDRCPNSPSGSKVDTEGCLLSLTLKVNFDRGKSNVKEEYYSEIKKFADFMKGDSSLSVEIQGHTDNIGNKAANMKLSDKRANEVMKVLVEKFGIAKSRISAKGYGDTKPIESNETPEGAMNNRRVEAVVIK